jgi:hypothetical protein
VIVRCGADSAATENDVATFEGAPVELDECCPIVARVVGPGQREAALPQQGDDLRQVLVLPLALKYLVADDDEPEATRAHGRTVTAVGMCEPGKRPRPGAPDFQTCIVSRSFTNVFAAR